MEVTRVLHMNGGNEETSYARNSYVPRKVISLTKGMREEAIRSMYCSTLPKQVSIADLGCSCGPNTLVVIDDAIKSVEKLCREWKQQSPEYQVHMNDLPGNDFNTLFKSLDSFKKKLSDEVEGGIGPCYFRGVSGSFYGRIFPTKSLHFVHSCYSLQWLSQVPEGVENNKGNIYMARTSPTNVLKAYYKQFQRDFLLFLKCRAEEVVEGGRMVLTFLGRRSDNPSTKECCYIWELLALALNHMVSEGIIKEEQMDSFNIPQYTPSLSEVKLEVLKEGSFTIDHHEVSEVHWNAYDNSNNNNNNNSTFDSECNILYESSLLKNGHRGYNNIAKLMRSVSEPLLVSHFGEAIIEEVFGRYQKILTDRMSKEITKFINVSISMTRRAHEEEVVV